MLNDFGLFAPGMRSCFGGRLGNPMGYMVKRASKACWLSLLFGRGPRVWCASFVFSLTSAGNEMSTDEDLRVRILTKAQTAPLDDYRKRTEALRQAQAQLGRAMSNVNSATKDLRDYKNRQSIPVITAGM
ncbi:hypothetical protein FGG78_26305, partial [Thioclava sp. BHET1]